MEKANSKKKANGKKLNKKKVKVKYFKIKLKLYLLYFIKVMQTQEQCEIWFK